MSVIRGARGIVITAGAGMGVCSGLPDFRGTEGFWRAYPPMARLGLTFPEVSTPRWFDEDPEFAWGFFGHRQRLYQHTQPHDGFRMLLEMCQTMPEGYFVVTSNVDGHFQKAGFDPERVFEVHGNLHHWQCRRGCSGIWEASYNVEVNEETFRAKPPLPRCPKCQAYARPNVLMFNDYGFQMDKRLEQEEKFNAFVRPLIQKEVPFAVIEIGAGLAVPTIRMAGERLLDLSPHASLIRINPRDTEVPSYLSKRAFTFPTTAMEAITELVELRNAKVDP